MSDKLELSDKLGAAVVEGVGVMNYTEALLHGRSETLSYADMQEFQDFTANYFTATFDGELVLFRKADGAALKNKNHPYVFIPDGTSVSDYADKM